jgi:SAM-dependent methyltransferase
MNRGFYLQTSLIEERHWWFVQRRRLAAALLSDEPGRGRRGLALDIGCGTGGNLVFLQQHCSGLAGVDLSDYALELARAKQTGAGLIRADANSVGDLFRASSFDLVTIFNLLYHRWVRDDSALLAQAAHLLRPGGLLLVTEPAFDILKRRHDVVDYGARRYRRESLVSMSEQAGLEIRRATYFNSIAFAPALLSAFGERLFGWMAGAPDESEEVAEMRVPPRPLNRFLLRLSSLESRLIRAVGRLPFGVGLLVMAAKPAATGTAASGTAASGTCSKSGF